MPEDNQAIENRHKGQDGESARQEFTIAQRKKRERTIPEVTSRAALMARKSPSR